MVIQRDYYQELTSVARLFLEKKFRLSPLNWSNFDYCNAFLSLNLPEKQNLWLHPGNDKHITNIAKTVIQALMLDCFFQNARSNKQEFFEEEKIACCQSASVWEIKEAGASVKIRQLHPILHAKRTTKEHLDGFVWIRERGTSLDRKLSEYKELSQFFTERPSNLPFQNHRKVVLVGSKNELKELLQNGFPYQILKRDGTVDTEHLPFDPIALIASNYDAIHDWLREKSRFPPTVVFIGNRYEGVMANVRRDFREGKIEKCIFIGSASVDSTDVVPVLRWRWTIQDLHSFGLSPFLLPEIVQINDVEIEAHAHSYLKILKSAEQQSQGFASLHRFVFFLRRAFALAALEPQGRLKNEIANLKKYFSERAPDWLADELYAPGLDCYEVLGNLQSAFFNLLDHIGQSNAKALYFRDLDLQAEGLVVRRRDLPGWQQEQKKLKPPIQSTYSLGEISTLASKVGSIHFPYKSLKNTLLHTLQDFENDEGQAQGKHFFLSLFGYEIPANELFECLLQAREKVLLLLYPPEVKAYKCLSYRLELAMVREMRSPDRETLTGLKWQIQDFKILEEETHLSENWLELLIENSGKNDQPVNRPRKYEIHFEEGGYQKEAESRRVLLENSLERYKTIKDLKRGDCIRLYSNPDSDAIFHTLAKLKDKEGIFLMAYDFSKRWKDGLRDMCWPTNNIPDVFENLKEKGLSVSETTFRGWLEKDSKVLFPQRPTDLATIARYLYGSDWKTRAKDILFARKKITSHLIRMGTAYSEEINQFLVTGGKGELLQCLNEHELSRTLATNASPRTIKSIKLLDDESDIN